jgi:protein SCO1/2
VRRLGVAVCTALLLSAGLLRATEDQRPPALRDVGFDQKLGEALPLDVRLRDETGREVVLGEYFRGKPVVLSLVYYECPMLCTLSLNGLASALDVLAFTPGQEFELLTLSFDSSESAELAAAKKQAYLGRYKRPGAERGWHFLTGERSEIERLTAAVGFRFAWDEQTKQFAHPAGVVVVSPQGRIAHYLYGIEYAPKDLRLALVEAGDGRIGTAVDQVLLYCYQYNPLTGRYSASIMALVRLAGAATVLALGGFILVMRRREARAGRAAGQAP